MVTPHLLPATRPHKGEIMIMFSIVLIVSVICVTYWKQKKFDHFWLYFTWVAIIVTLAYFIFSPQGIGDIIK